MKLLVAGMLALSLAVEAPALSVGSEYSATSKESSAISTTISLHNHGADHKPVVQSRLVAFTPRSTDLNSRQQSQIRNLLVANDSAEKFICTGIRSANASRAEALTIRTQAKAACDAAKRINPELSTWVQAKTTNSASYAGRVLLTLKNPPPVSAIEDISDLSGQWKSSALALSWTKPAEVEGFKYFEVGLAVLKQDGGDRTKHESFMPTEFYRVTQDATASLTATELKNFLVSKTSSFTDQAVLVQVRTVGEKTTSDWGRGVSVPIAQIEQVIANEQAAQAPPPAQSPPPAPAPEQPAGGNSGGSAPPAPESSVGSEASPPPAPRYVVQRYTGFRSISCPAGTDRISAGVGTIPTTQWRDFLGNPVDRATVYEVRSTSDFGGYFSASGLATTYISQWNGSFVAPTGVRYFVFASGGWTNIPVWVTCGKFI